MASDLWGNHLGAAALIFLCGLVGSLFPLFVHRFAPQSKNKNCQEYAMLFLTLGSCFGGGVFIAAGFIHLLGDASNDMKAYMNESCTLSDDVCGYPWDMLACSLGLLVTMLIDSIPYIIDDKKKNRQCRKPQASVKDAEEGAASYGAAEDGHGHGHGLDVATKSPVVAYILFAALSFHSFMAGLALGVTEDAFNSLLFAIFAHKGFAAFALGAEFVQMEARTKQIEDGDQVEQKWCLTPTGVTVRIAIFMSIFCLMTPLGVIIGTVALADADGLPIAVLTAIAAGTFLYVGIVEVTAAELMGKAKEGRTGLKIIFVVTGFGLMALLGVWS